MNITSWTCCLHQLISAIYFLCVALLPLSLSFHHIHLFLSANPFQTPKNCSTVSLSTHSCHQSSVLLVEVEFVLWITRDFLTLIDLYLECMIYYRYSEVIFSWVSWSCFKTLILNELQPKKQHLGWIQTKHGAAVETQWDSFRSRRCHRCRLFQWLKLLFTTVSIMLWLPITYSSDQTLTQHSELHNLTSHSESCEVNQDPSRTVAAQPCLLSAQCQIWCECSLRLFIIYVTNCQLYFCLLLLF